MLILTRHNQESIIVTLPDGRRATITVVEIRRDKVRLAFEAPSDILIHREEVQRRVDAEKRGGST